MDPILGMITQYAFNFAPSYWMVCEGQTLNISTNQSLFTLIGSKFGGNGTTTFCLPDLRNAVVNPVMKYYIAIQGIYPSRS